MTTVCNNCSGNGGYYDRPNGERYLSDEGDGTPWTMCPECEGSGRSQQRDKVEQDTLNAAIKSFDVTALQWEETGERHITIRDFMTGALERHERATRLDERQVSPLQHTQRCVGLEGGE